MGTHAEFRKYAQQCIEIARKTNNPVLRDTMLEMAETWLGFAGASKTEFDQVRSGRITVDAARPAQEPDAR